MFGSEAIVEESSKTDLSTVGGGEFSNLRLVDDRVGREVLGFDGVINLRFTAERVERRV